MFSSWVSCPPSPPNPSPPFSDARSTSAEPGHGRRARLAEHVWLLCVCWPLLFLVLSAALRRAPHAPPPPPPPAAARADLQGCLLFGSSTGCTSPVTAYGCAQSSTVNGTLDLLAADVAQGGTARCGCSAPYSLSTGANPWNGPSSRVAEKLVETLVAASGGVALVSATAGATTAPWDYYRSASALCTTAMQGAGCGPGLLYASNPAQSPNNFVCQCKSGADVAHVYDATLRVEQLVVDAVTNNYSAWSYTANGYLCDNFVGVCNSALTAFGCAATNINGCGSSTPGGALTAFVGSCGCNSPWTSPTSPTPASPSDVIGNRVMENIISNALPPNVVPLFLQYTVCREERGEKNLRHIPRRARARSTVTYRPPPRSRRPAHPTRSSSTRWPALAPCATPSCRPSTALRATMRLHTHPATPSRVHAGASTRPTR